jgi:hypothetical protein
MESTTFYDLDLDTKPDFVECMKRVYAWYDGEILDRVPVRFAGHNEEFNTSHDATRWDSIKDRWFDTEYRIDSFLSGMCGRKFLGETFPVFWPNLGPNVFAGMLGCTIEFGDVTSWAHPFITSPTDIDKIELDKNSEYYLKLMELTRYAIERCEHKFMVGYTDMHPGLDCVDAMYGTTEVCLGIYDDPEAVKAMATMTFAPFKEAMDDFHGLLKAARQLSVTWLNIPSYESMHIPSCDLGAMLSQEAFNEFALPSIDKEIGEFRHNIFHVDGPGVATHINALLELDRIQAYQWVQGVGNDRPIARSLDFIRKIQYSKKSVVVDIQTDELDMFMSEMKPAGIYLCINESDEEVQQEILVKLLHWK